MIRSPAPSAYRPRFQLRFLLPQYWPAWLVLLLLGVLAWMPWPVRSAVAAPIGELAYRTRSKRRRYAEINLGLCFPNMSEGQRRRFVRRHFHLSARCVVDYGILWWRGAGRIRRLVRVQGERYFREQHEKNRPIILLTCHTTPLDFGAAGLTVNYPGIGLVQRMKSPLVDWLIQRGRTRFHARLSARERGLLPVVRSVRGGAFLYYLPDEDLNEPETVFAPFFGVQRNTLATLGRLARTCNAVILPSYTYYVAGKGYYENRIFPALADFPTDSLEGDARRMNKEIEKLIQLAPEQYMWTMWMFKTRPPGERSPYKEGKHAR